MILLSSSIKTFEAECLEQYQESILPSHRKALEAMKGCRTSSSPHMLAQCTACDSQLLVPHSCGHRNCPHCQHYESQQWLQRQLQKQVPAEYFLLTFTLPKELRPLAWRHQRTLYSSMTRCSWETVQTFSHNDTQLHGKPGAITVLHTHSHLFPGGSAHHGSSSNQAGLKKIFPIESNSQLFQRARPTNGSDCGSLRSHNLSLFVSRVTFQSSHFSPTNLFNPKCAVHLLSKQFI